MEVNEVFLQSIIKQKLKCVKDKIILGEITIPKQIRTGNKSLSANNDIMNNIFNNYKMNLVNNKQNLLYKKMHQYDQKLKEIKLLKEEDFYNIKCYVQPMKSKPIKTHCKLLNEEIESELESNAANFIKRLQQDKHYRKKRENERAKKNMNNYISEWKKSFEINMKQQQYDKKKHELQKNERYNYKNRNNSYNYKESLPSLIQNHSNSQLSNQSSFKIKSPTLGICLSRPVLKQFKVHNKIREAGENFISFNENNYIHNNNSNQNIIQYVKMEPSNKITFELNNQRKSPYYFNEPKYNPIIQLSDKRLHSKDNDKTNNLIE